MALTNAEKQARWRAKRNRLARQAERLATIEGLINALVAAAKRKTAAEIDAIVAELQQRLAAVRAKKE